MFLHISPSVTHLPAFGSSSHICLKHQWVLGKPAGRETLFIKQSYSMPTHWHLSLCISRSFFLSGIMNMHAVGSVPPERKGTCVCVCVCDHVCTEAYVCISGDLGCWSWMSVKRFASFFFYIALMCAQEQTLLCFMTNWVFIKELI